LVKNTLRLVQALNVVPEIYIFYITIFSCQKKETNQ